MGPTGRLARIPNQARSSVFDGELPVVAGEPDTGSPTSLFDPPGPLRPGTLDLQIPAEQAPGAHRHRITVRASDIDIFNHVNAANYVRYVASSLAHQGHSPSIHRAELKYTGQARLGDVLDVVTWPLGGTQFAADVMRDDEVLFRCVVETEAELPQTGR